MPGTFQVAVEALIEKDEKLLITRRADDRDHGAGEWETITGRVEQGEAFEDAVHREVNEETGLTVKIVKPLGTFHFYRGKEKIEHLGLGFFCRYVSGEIKLDPHESSDFRWATKEEALRLIADQSTRVSIQNFFGLISGKS
jgi:mutator protein MutT